MSLTHEEPTRLVVLISGHGSNLQAIIDACSNETLPSTKIVRVICNRKNAFGIERAKKAQIPWTYHNIIPFRGKFPGDEKAAKYAFDDELATLILNENPHLVVCAGWMLVLSAAFIDRMAKATVPIINLHPSLPAPNAIEGANAISRAYEAFQKGEIEKTGCMIHYVIEEVDSGECLVFQEIPMQKGESLEDLEARIHQEEWVLIVEGIRKAIRRLGREY